MNDAKINEIRQYEIEAKDIVEKAKIEYQNIIMSAESEGNKLFETAREKVNKKKIEIIEEYKKESKEEHHKIMTGFELDIKKLEDSAKDNERRALEYIKDTIKKLLE